MTLIPNNEEKYCYIDCGQPNCPCKECNPNRLIRKELETLDEFNKLMFNKYGDHSKPVKNGIACPNCGEELYDSDPMVVLTSYPPQKSIKCKNCNYHGFRYA